MTQLALDLDRTCPVKDVPYADGSGTVRMHECGRYAENIWPCTDCDDHPGDRSVPAVKAFAAPDSVLRKTESRRWTVLPGAIEGVRP